MKGRLLQGELPGVEGAGFGAGDYDQRTAGVAGAASLGAVSM